jgi:hypothetical protein
LSQFVESKLLETIRNLIKRREEYKDQHEGKEYESFEGLNSPYSFYNDQIWAELKDLMDGKEIPGKSESFYSAEYGAITHKRVTGLYKSKLKAEPLIARSETGTKRGLKFSKDVLDKLDSYYNVPDEIEIDPMELDLSKLPEPIPESLQKIFANSARIVSIIKTYDQDIYETKVESDSVKVKI